MCNLVLSLYIRVAKFRYPQLYIWIPSHLNSNEITVSWLKDSYKIRWSLHIVLLLESSCDVSVGHTNHSLLPLREWYKGCLSPGDSVSLCTRFTDSQPGSLVSRFTRPVLIAKSRLQWGPGPRNKLLCRYSSDGAPAKPASASYLELTQMSVGRGGREVAVNSKLTRQIQIGNACGEAGVPNYFIFCLPVRERRWSFIVV